MAEISKTADQALVLLVYIAENGPLGTTELARRLGMHRTVVHRLLTTLQNRSFVRRVEAGYLPGTALLHLAQFVEPALLTASREMMNQLAATHGETFILSAPQWPYDAIQVEQSVGDRHFMRVELTRGFRHSLASGASGRSILAFSDQKIVDHFLGRVEDPDLLRRQLEDVRTQGFASSKGELSPGVHGVSVPILVDGEPVASIGVAYPAMREAAAPSYTRALQKAATAIARKIKNDGV